MVAAAFAPPPRAIATRTTGGVVARVAVWAAIVLTVVALNGYKDSYSRIAGTAAIYAMIALSLNVVIGYVGQLSLGHQGFLGVGACFAAYAATVQGFPFPVALVVGAVSGALFALMLGAVALRITGLYLSLVTLVFGLTLSATLFQVQALTNGGAGQPANRPTYVASNERYFYLCIALLAVVFYLDRRLTSSKGGRALLALKENERVAEAFGINVTAYKLLAFVFSGAVAGLAGALYAFNSQQFSGSNYDFILALTFVVMTVVGGAGSRPGVMLGGVLFVVLRPVLSPLFMGTGFIASIVQGRLGPLADNAVYLPDIIGVVLFLLTVTRFPGGIAQQLAPVFTWMTGGPFSKHAGESGPGAVEGSSVRA